VVRGARKHGAASDTTSGGLPHGDGNVVVPEREHTTRHGHSGSSPVITMVHTPSSSRRLERVRHTTEGQRDTRRTSAMQHKAEREQNRRSAWPNETDTGILISVSSR
jgi:hypothetical protein